MSKGTGRMPEASSSELGFFEMDNEQNEGAKVNKLQAMSDRGKYPMSDREKYPILAKAFAEALLETIRSEAKKNGGKWEATTANLRACAIEAFAESMESEFDSEGNPLVFSPRLLANVWCSEIKINESAYRQGLQRMEKAKTLGFELITSTAAKAGDYV